MQAALIVVDEYRGCDVHGIDQTKAFCYAAPLNEFFDCRCNVDESASARNLEPKMFSERFQWGEFYQKAESFPGFRIRLDVQCASAIEDYVAMRNNEDNRHGCI